MPPTPKRLPNTGPTTMGNPILAPRGISYAYTVHNPYAESSDTTEYHDSTFLSHPLSPQYIFHSPPPSEQISQGESESSSTISDSPPHTAPTDITDPSHPFHDNASHSASAHAPKNEDRLSNNVFSYTSEDHSVSKAILGLSIIALLTIFLMVGLYKAFDSTVSQPIPFNGCSITPDKFTHAGFTRVLTKTQEVEGTNQVPKGVTHWCSYRINDLHFLLLGGFAPGKFRKLKENRTEFDTSTSHTQLINTTGVETLIIEYKDGPYLSYMMLTDKGVFAQLSGALPPNSPITTQYYDLLKKFVANC